MKQLFHITGQPADIERSDVFLAELGEEYGCIARYSSGAESIAELSYYTFDRFSQIEVVKTLLSEMKDGANFEKVILCTALPQALLTPAALYSQDHEEDLVKGVYDITGCAVLHNDINLWQLTNVFAVPQSLVQAFNVTFPTTVHKHIYTTLLKSIDRFSERDEILLHFTPANFVIIIRRGRQLMLVQTFAYTVPLDVVYVLLKACTELRINREEIYIILSGLVDQSSGLYKELYYYFMHLSFASSNVVALPPNDYPPHFFTSIYNLVACAL